MPESNFDEVAAVGYGRRQPEGPQLDPIRIALLVASWIALAGLLMGVGEFVTHSGRVQGFDNRVTSIVVAHRSEGLNAATKAMTWLGSWVAVLVVAVALVLFVVGRKLSVGFLLLAVLLWGGTQGGTTLAKHVVQRSRPPEHLRLVSAYGWSWPSGHTATATLVFAVLAAAVWVVIPKTGPRVLAALGWIVVTAVVAFSRVELGVHWTTDVLASAVFATAWLLVAGVLFISPMGWSRPLQLRGSIP